jgi:hypothetical protein
VQGFGYASGVLRHPLCALAIATLAAAGCASPRAPVAQAAFEFPRGQILVTATLEGHPGHRCLVDTGANPSVIDLRVARDLGLAIAARSGAAEGIGKEDVRVHPTTLGVDFGGSSGRIDALAVDLSRLARAFGRPIDCILGQSWLATRAVEFDYPARILRFPDRPAARPGCAAGPMRFWMADDLMPLVTVQVNGVDVDVSVDTGSGATLRLFAPADARTGVRLDADEGASVTGIRGRTAVRTATATHVRYGPLVLDEVRVTVSAKNEGEPAGRSGNLGNGVMRHGILVLDYPARRIAMCPA